MDYLKDMYCALLYGSDSRVPKKIVAFGNVMLDLTANIDDMEILERYGIKLETKGELDTATLTAIHDEVSSKIVGVAHPGGSALNTVRILKQLGTDALFCGAIGNDAPGTEIRKFLEEKQISAKFQTINDYQTGQCLCFVYQDKTALYANIGASSQFGVDFLKQIESDDEQLFLRPIEKRQIFYIEGFFVPQRQEVCRYILEQYIKEKHILAFNLSSGYIIDENFDDVLNLVKHSFFLFGNYREFTTLRTKMGHNSLEDLAKAILCPDDAKILIITKGSQNVTLITNYNGDQSVGPVTFEQFNVPHVEEIVDTTGAGDSFVAGFLHAFLEKRSISECVRFASSIACQVVTQIGCNLPS